VRECPSQGNGPQERRGGHQGRRPGRGGGHRGGGRGNGNRNNGGAPQEN
jgi:hypothetical protein